MKKLFSIMSDIQTHYHVKLDFQKVDRHTGGMCDASSSWFDNVDQWDRKSNQALGQVTCKDHHVTIAYHLITFV